MSSCLTVSIGWNMLTETSYASLVYLWQFRGKMGSNCRKTPAEMGIGWSKCVIIITRWRGLLLVYFVFCLFCFFCLVLNAAVGNIHAIANQRVHNRVFDSGKRVVDSMIKSPRSQDTMTHIQPCHRVWPPDSDLCHKMTNTISQTGFEITKVNSHIYYFVA